MATSLAYRFCGPTVGLSVAATSHAAVTINATDPSANALLFCNTSTAVVVYVKTASTVIGQGTAPSAAAATIPGDGTIGDFPILAYDDTAIAGMVFPVSVTAIGSAAGPTLFTATPVCLL
jgi:hypothetical protein